MNPLSIALLSYHSGDTDACFTIMRDDGFEQTVPAKVFFEAYQFPEMEVRALDLCFGAVLDVGTAAGRHSLELHRRGMEVWSLDVLPETKQILTERGVPRPVTGDILSWNERSFDTILMLMNGIGMVGTPQRLDNFLQHAHRLISSEGQILCDSIDVSVTQVPIHIAYRSKNVERGLYPGQQRFTIRYGDILGEPFDWLHLDFTSLGNHCQKAGWACQLMQQDSDGHYLAKIFQGA